MPIDWEDIMNELDEMDESKSDKVYEPTIRVKHNVFTFGYPHFVVFTDLIEYDDTVDSINEKYVFYRSMGLEPLDESGLMEYAITLPQPEFLEFLLQAGIELTEDHLDLHNNLIRTMNRDTTDEIEQEYNTRLIRNHHRIARHVQLINSQQ